ncbi:hypothetical protein, partial [Lichenibacterium minor]|uniref:hypothetical protein n=1 Tax=Lichenibacterium minor TaxID=2316528 RepID=UPI001A915F40
MAHRHDFHQFVFSLKGDMRIEVSGIEGSVDLCRGVVVPRDALHVIAHLPWAGVVSRASGSGWIFGSTTA